MAQQTNERNKLTERKHIRMIKTAVSYKWGTEISTNQNSMVTFTQGTCFGEDKNHNKQISIH
jgi:hypothetical protein